MIENAETVHENWLRLKRTYDVCDEIVDERQRQFAKFGEQNPPDGTGLAGSKFAADEARHVCDALFKRGHGTWNLILTEEFSEAMAERDEDKLREELIQVAAVAVAWGEAIDRRKSTRGHDYDPNED